MTRDIADLAARFKWVSDGKLDSYRILNNPTGPLEGDCDDFAVTALWLVEDKSMGKFWWALITGKARIWYVKGDGWASHVVLNHKDYGWIDNQNMTWGENRDVLRFWLPFPLVAMKMLIGKIKGR